MPEETSLCFGPFRLDVANEEMWQGQETLKLTRKAWAVLRYLVEHAGQLVTKETLFQALWPEVVVGDAALTVCIRELRQVLGDDSKTPQYIETVYGRGYRWIAPLSPAPAQRGAGSGEREASPLASVALRSSLDALRFVGRDAELTQLQQWLEKAATGQRQMVFITGEPGIGKTTVVEAFLYSLASGVQRRESEQDQNEEAKQKAKGKRQKLAMTDPRPLTPVPWVGRGQCIEHHGAGEAYMPILEALVRVCRVPRGEHVVTVLSQYAPTWLVQLPALLKADELAALQSKMQGATRERMLRELAEALEALTAERPLVLVLEDLHWSDPSTLDLLALVARRREPARLLILGTYRPSELLATDHPLRTVIQELLGHQQCQELALEGLSETAIEKYLERRFPVQVFPTRLAQVLQQRTGGNPLFLVNLVDELVTHNILTDGEGGWMVHGEIEELVQQVPDTSRQLIAAQMARVSPATQQTLAAASVAGTIFSAAAVAAALETPITEVEVQCEAVVQQQLFLQRTGIEAWPDGTEAARYGFRHALYQELWHEQGTINQRRQWHQRIGLRKEGAYNERASEVAAELAVHFEQGHDTRRAVQYLQQAAQNALQRLANAEAIYHLTKGLELLKTLPDTPERIQQELTLQIALGVPLITTKGQAAPEVEHSYNRALQLCREMGETPQLFPVLHGLFRFYVGQAEYRTARQLAERLLTLAQDVQDPTFLLWAHVALEFTLILLGEFTLARTHLEQAITLYDRQKHNPRASRTVGDPGVVCLTYGTLALWLLGYPDQAVKRNYEALTLAQEISHSYSLAHALNFAASLHRFRREEKAVQEWAEAAMILCAEQGFALHLAMGTCLRGWALAEQGQGKEGITQIRQGITAFRTTGAEITRPLYLALLAEAYGKIGQIEEGLSVLAEALTLVDEKGERFYEAEIYRLRGELTLAQSRVQSLGSRVQTRQKSKIKRQKAKVPDPRPLTPDPQSEAEGYFLKAIEVAQRQQAKSLELRATVSLAHLWQSQGKPREAHRVLAEVYGWFTEGFDTKDLQEAKMLLDSLT